MLLFLIKIFNFYQKQQLRSPNTLPAHLLSVAKNSALYVMPAGAICKYPLVLPKTVYISRFFKIDLSRLLCKTAAIFTWSWTSL